MYPTELNFLTLNNTVFVSETKDAVTGMFRHLKLELEICTMLNEIKH